MANFHSRSNSFPSQSHPMMNNVEEKLLRLIKASEETSTSCDSLCSNLSDLGHLSEDVNDIIQMSSSIQQLSISQEHAGQNWVNDLLDDSLGLVDLCGFARDVLCLKKGSLQELQSSIRRSRRESATVDEIDAYLISHKKINKKIHKFVKNLKSFHKNSNNTDHERLSSVLKEVSNLQLSTLKSVLAFIAEGKFKRSKHISFSLLSKFMKGNRVHSEVAENQQFLSLKQLERLEVSIHEVDEGLESLFRSLVKTRVSLLNVLSQIRLNHTKCSM